MGPLSGFKVIEMASIGPIPMCGMLLADLGAQVIRIDRLGDSDLGVKRDPAFEYTSRGKRSIAADLKSPEACAMVLRLARGADVLIEGYRPGVMERLGLGPGDCLQANPALIYGRLTGWGQDGPLSQAAAHDMNFIALTGALDAIGLQDGPPVAPLNLLGDFAGGSLFLAMGVAAALAERARSGRGQVIDAAIVDGVSALLASMHGQVAGGIWRERRGEHITGGGAPWNTVYETSDGLYVTVCAIESRFYATLLEKLGLDADTLPDRMDRINWPVLKNMFGDIFLGRTRAQWCELLEGTDTCFAPVLTLKEAQSHPHAQHRGMFEGEAGRRQPAAAPRFDRTRNEIAGPPVLAAGQHTDEILADWGFAVAEIAGLHESGALA